MATNTLAYARAYSGGVRVECPVCGQPTDRAIPEPPNHFRCSSCDVIYRRASALTAPEDGWDKSYYSDEVIMNFYQRRRSGFAKIVSLINRLVPERGNWLDIGCGPGALLQVASEQGWQVFGIEPSSICFDTVQASVPSAKVVHGTVEKKLSEFSNINVASMVCVLASIENPGATLTNIHGVLADGGWVIVRETNADARRDIRARETPNVKVGTTRLLQEWSPRSLENALRLAGFRNVHSLPSPPFLETTGNESGLDEGVKKELKVLAKQGLWPISRVVHSLSGGRVFLLPNFISVGQRGVLALLNLSMWFVQDLAEMSIHLG